ncbi:MAG TPA: tetratricopeptide repeat protein [Pyrinomonadaceae bacterium]|nr:tetratricopeptide repeat protein [Pyrinomonadaceae bacterium]
MLKKILISILFTLVLASVLPAQTSPGGSDTVLILPFENTSGKPEFNWVGESFADSLSNLLRVPTLNVVSNEERKIIQQRLRIPLTNIPSLATSLKMARDANATLLISGRYTIVPAGAETAATINVTSKIVRVNEGRFMSEVIDGRQVTRDINMNDALGNLQTIQGQIAYQILYQRDKALPYSQNQLIEAANTVPSRAFEAYIKGLLTADKQAREIYFTNASREFSKAIPDGVYTEAEIELGHIYLGQRKFSESIGAFEKVVSASQKCRDKAKAENKQAQCSDENYAEASFYIGLIFWQQGNYEPALATLRPLTDDLKLTTVYNALGAIAVQASRAEKKNPAKAAALLNEGMELLKKASESAPDDANVRFNYATALFFNGNTIEAATQLRSTIAANPRDGEAYYIFSKVLDTLKDPSVTDINNQAQRFLTDNNRYAKLETEWQKSKTISEITLRVNQPARKDFVAVVLSRKPVAASTAEISETESLLGLARTLIKNGNDDEAMTTLRRVLASEPMSAESYFLLGKIHLRRGDIDQAISSFKTSIFWDNKLIDAHVSLGKIYIEKGDCLQAKSFVASALEIGPDNPDALALQRSSERCSK